MFSPEMATLWDVAHSPRMVKDKVAAVTFVHVCVHVLSSPQMYVHHGIHDLIFNFVGTLEASQVGVAVNISTTM